MSKSQTHTVASWVVQVVSFAVRITDGPSDFRIVPSFTGAKSILLIIWSEAPESTMSFLLRWRTLLAGLGLKNLCWFSEYEPRILYPCLCNVQTDFLLATSFMRKVYSKDLSPNVGAFGFRWFWDPVWTTPSVVVLQFLLFRTYLFARWWSLTRDWVLSSDCTFCNCIWRSSFGGMRIAIVADFFFSSADLAVCLQTQLSPNLHPLQFGILCIREHANNYMHFPFWHCCSWRTFYQLPFRSPFEFRCGLPFPLPFLFGSRLNAHESPHQLWPSAAHRVQPPLSELFLAVSLPFPLAFPLLGASVAGLPSSRFLALK